MMGWSRSMHAADDKRAGSAGEVADRIHSPPLLIGSEALTCASSVRERLRTISRPERKVASYCTSPGWFTQRQLHGVWSSLLEPSGNLNRTRTSCLAMFASLTDNVAHSE